MSALDTLTQLRSGTRPTSGLLHHCRLHAFGSEVYGEEAIVERFRALPYVPADPVTVAVPGHFAMFAGAGAIIADLSGDNIARMWRVGPGPAILPEPGVSVVFDPDLAQARGNVFFAASDHPALAVDAADRALEAGRAITRDDNKSYRTRAFAVRAFGTAIEGVALFAVYRLTGAPVRTSGFAMAAVRWTPDDLQIVRDLAGEQVIAERRWTPSVGD